MSSSSKKNTSTIFMGPKESREITVDSSGMPMQTASMDAPSSQFATIFMGPDTSRETRFDLILDDSMRNQWNRDREALYIEGVKKKASNRVRAMLLEAKLRSDTLINEAQAEARSLHLEAEDLKKQAEELLAQAEQEFNTSKERVLAEVLEENRQIRESAEEDIEKRKTDLKQTSAVVLMSIHQQCNTIFEAWRQEMSELLLEVIRTSTAWVVSHERAAMFTKLLEQSMLMLLDKQEYTIKVNSQDTVLVKTVLEDTGAGRWNVEEDTNLEPGSLIVETKNSLVDNSREAREDLVRGVLKNLTLPFTQIDQEAFVALTENLVTELAKNEIDLDENQTDTNLNGTKNTPPNDTNNADDLDDLDDLDDVHATSDMTDADAMDADNISTANDMNHTNDISDTDVGQVTSEDSAQADTQDSTNSQEMDSSESINSDASMDSTKNQASEELQSPIEQNKAEPISHEDASNNEAEDLVNQFLGDAESFNPEAHSEKYPDGEALSDTAVTAVQEGLLSSLSPDLADDLIAEMGFSPEKDGE